jgi:phenylpyruvate tautomerase PptA (4-oxalocrotonate tautomerase family)
LGKEIRIVFQALAPFYECFLHDDGGTAEQKAGVAKDITVAMSKHLGVHEEAVRIIFQELKEDQIGG